MKYGLLGGKMTNKDMHEIFYNLRKNLNDFSKDELRQVFCIMLSAQQRQEHHYTAVGSVDLVRYTRKLLNHFIKYDEILNLFDKKQIKSLYKILANYDYYPICPLCNRPIIMRSNNKHPDEFSWDHVMPKSLGGSSDLFNLQPTHKGCNNRKGNDILYHVHYEINVVVDIDVQHQHKKKNLHKKDYWRQGGRCR